MLILFCYRRLQKYCMILQLIEFLVEVLCSLEIFCYLDWSAEARLTSGGDRLTLLSPMLDITTPSCLHFSASWWWEWDVPLTQNHHVSLTIARVSFFSRRDQSCCVLYQLRYMGFVHYQSTPPPLHTSKTNCSSYLTPHPFQTRTQTTLPPLYIHLSFSPASHPLPLTYPIPAYFGIPNNILLLPEHTSLQPTKKEIFKIPSRD